MHSEQHHLIADTVQRLFSDHADEARRQCEATGDMPASLWQLVADNGLHLALAGAEAGGSELSWPDAYPILHGIGYWQVPLPLAETMVAAALLSGVGIEVPEGPITLIEAGRQAGLRLSREGDAFVLDGEATEVPWAGVSNRALVSGDGALALVDLSGAGVTITAGHNTAGERRDGVAFAQVRSGKVAHLSNGAPQEPVFLLGALARSAMMVGALESALDMSVTYANDRSQFGRPIGKYQAIQQSLAELAGEVTSAAMATQVACEGVSAGWGTASFDIAVAKVRAGEAATRAPVIAHQVHGAIGFTHEHALHHATQRLWAWRREFGSDGLWAGMLGRAAMAAGSGGFWQGVTARKLPAA